MRPEWYRARVALTVAATVLSVSRAGAQVTEVSRTPIGDEAQLTFGYLCDDRFVIRNDGTNSVELAYSIAKSNEHVSLTINGRETVELSSKSKEAMELWVDGKLVAKAPKEKRACKDVQGHANVVVEPLNVRANQSAGINRGAAFGSPFFDPWYGAYGGFRGWYPGFYNGFYGGFRPSVIFVRGGGRRGR